MQPPARRERLIDDAFALMGREGVFVQFTYGSCRQFRAALCAGRYTARRSRADLAEPAAGAGLDLSARRRQPASDAAAMRECSRPATG